MVWISTGYEQQHLDFQSAILLLRTKTGRPYGMNASWKDKLIPNYLLVAAVNGFGVSWKCKFWKEKKSAKLNIRISEFSKGKLLPHVLHRTWKQSLTSWRKWIWTWFP